jgi:hypothetical protein
MAGQPVTANRGRHRDDALAFGAAESSGNPARLLILVVFWLTLLFASFGLFAPHNLTAGLALGLCALAVTGGLEMILELEQPFAGLVQILPMPMREALAMIAK